MTTTRVRRTDLLLVLLALSCGGGDAVTSPVGDDDDGPGDSPSPLIVTQTDPTDGATDVEIGARVVARFNRAPDPATLTPSSFTVALGGISLPGRILHEAGSTQVTLIAPLLPGVELDYETTVTPDVRDAGGQSLAQPHRWSFRTRAVRQSVIPTAGDDGEQTALALDAGGVHASHVGNGNVLYSTCGTECTDPANWQSAVVDRGGRSTSLRVDPTGRRHLMYYGAENELRYAACTAGCESPASWTIATIDPGIAGDSRVSLVLDGSNALHVAYYDANLPFVKYAACSADCTDPANWASTVPDLPGAIGREASLAIDGAGRLHLVSHDQTNGRLDYATCQSDCLGNGWQAATIDPTDDAGASTAIAAGGEGRLHVVYHADATDDLRYATCAAGCTNPAAWQTAILDAAADAGEFASIAVDDAERLYATYWHVSGARETLFLTTCASDCADGSNWRRTTIDGGGRLGRYNAVAVDPGGRIHATYYDQDRRDLKYLE